MTYQQFPVVGPFKGFVDSMPSPHNPPNAFDEIVNFICRKGRFQTRPRIQSVGAPPDNAIIRYMKTYTDVMGFMHTLCLTTKNAYALTSGPTFNPLTYPAGVTTLEGTALPYGTVVTNGRIYFSNGSKRIIYTDGEASLKDANAPGSARFLAMNAAHLIAAYTNEPEPGEVGSIAFPIRVRWSKSGDPNDWTAFGSGANDLVEVPDEITGLATLGRNTVVLRTNGFTAMVPTGDGAAPFNFENVSLSPLGIGNRYPYSLATYADMAAFVSHNEIYTINAGMGLEPIGTNAKKRIFRQIADSQADVIMGFPVSQLGPGIDYLSYWLVIPPDHCWVYHFDEGNWQEFQADFGRVTFVGQAIIEE